MIRACFIILQITFFLGVSYSQEKYNDLYNKLSLKNFEKHKAFSEQIDTANVDLELLNLATFFYTNLARVENKREFVVYSPQLEKSAAMHSESMVRSNFFNHHNKYEKKKAEPNDRAKLAGVVNANISENILQAFVLQYRSGTKVIADSPGVFKYLSNKKIVPPHTYLSLAKEMVDMWMNSPGHKENILSKNAVQLGCGSAFYYDKGFNSMPTILSTQNFQWTTLVELQKK